MGYSDTLQPADEVGESTRSVEEQVEHARHEAIASMGDLIQAHRNEMADRKNPERKPSFTSLNFGGMELIDDDGVPLLRRMTAESTLGNGKKSPQEEARSESWQIGAAVADSGEGSFVKYAQAERKTTAARILASIGWLTTDSDAVEQSLKNMTLDERQTYLRGKEIASRVTIQMPESYDPALGYRPLQAYLQDKAERDLSREQRQALSYYREVRAALEKAGNRKKADQWENVIKAQAR